MNLAYLLYPICFDHRTNGYGDEIRLAKLSSQAKVGDHRIVVIGTYYQCSVVQAPWIIGRAVAASTSGTRLSDGVYRH